MKRLCLIILCTISFAGQAQINLKVEFQSAKDKQVEVWMFDNFIVGTKALVFSLDQDLTTTFEKSIKTNHPGKIIVKTPQREKSFYIQPGFTYTIIIQSNNILVQSEDVTNERMHVVDELFTEYAKKGIRIPSGNYKKSYVPLMSALVSRLDTFYTDNKYFNNLLRYKIAAIKLIIIRHTTDLKNLQKLEAEYLSSPTIDYWNPLYIRFISNFYYDRWDDSRLRHQQSYLGETPYDTYFNELGFAENDTVKQIAALSFIKLGSTSYWGGTKEYTNYLLDSINKNAVNTRLRESIAYVKRQINMMNAGDIVKDFTYYDLNNQQIKLSHFQGKYVLLDFWFIGCTICHKAIPDIKQLQKKNSSCLEVVSINPIDDIEKVIKYKEKYNLKWHFISARHDSSIKSYFNITAYPTYFLIDPEGKFSLLPTNFDLGKIKHDIQAILKEGCRAE